MNPRRIAVCLAGCLVLFAVSACSDGAGSGTAEPSTTSTTSTTSPTSTTTGASAPSGPSGRIDLEIDTADGRTRTAHLHVPADLPDGPVPLLVGLHGGGGWGDQFERSSGFDAIADEQGAIVAYPDGTGVGADGATLRTWNGGVCCGRAQRDDVDDVAFVRQLVAEVEERYPIDPDRVFATGHSNGMIMSYRLACEAADVFVAVAGQAGTLGVDDCTPTEPVSLLHVHGAADDRLPIDGGRGTGLADLEFPSPRTGIATFAAAVGCPATATDEQVDAKVARKAWSPCAAGSEVAFVTVEDADHGWMGSTSSAHLDGVEPSQDFDTTAAVWSFLAAHPRS